VGIPGVYLRREAPWWVYRGYCLRREAPWWVYLAYYLRREAPWWVYPGYERRGHTAHTALPGMGEGNMQHIQPPWVCEEEGNMQHIQPPWVCERRECGTYSLPGTMRGEECGTYSLPGTMREKEHAAHTASLGPWEERWDTRTYRPWYHGNHTTPAYMGQPASLGGPHTTHGRTCRAALLRGSDGGTVQHRGAQEGETPWVGASQVPPSSKGVKVGMSFRAELLRPSG